MKLRSAKWLTAFALLGCALAPACSSEEDAKVLTYEAFTERYCAAHTPCCQLASLPTDGATCRASMRQFAFLIDFDPVVGDACLKEIAATTADPLYCQDFPEKFPSCLKATGARRATTPVGGTCTSDLQCAQPMGMTTVCTGGGSENGICQQELPGKLGDGPCFGEALAPGFPLYSDSEARNSVTVSYLCEVGLRCNEDTRKCEVPMSITTACDESNASSRCKRSSYCDLQKGTCVPRKAAGAACQSHEECFEARAFCDPAAAVCTPVRAPGQACGDNDECAGYCEGGICEGDPKIDTRIFCSEFSEDDDCLGDEYCDLGVKACILTKPIGAACTGPSACGSDAFCSIETGICTALRPLGAACTQRAECTEECTNGKCTIDLGSDLKWSFACGGD